MLETLRIINAILLIAVLWQLRKRAWSALRKDPDYLDLLWMFLWGLAFKDALFLGRHFIFDPEQMSSAREVATVVAYIVSVVIWGLVIKAFDWYGDDASTGDR